MNPSSYPPGSGQPSRKLVLWLLLASPVLLFMTLVAWVGSCFHLSPDVRALGNELTRGGGAEWRQQIALNANWMTAGAIRAVLSTVRLDPAACAVLQSVSAAGVGVYQLPAEAPRPDRVTLLTVADKVMAARGWERVVVVINTGDLVAIYSPARNIPFRLKCCVMVFSGRKLVLVSAQGNPEPLLEYSLNQALVPMPRDDATELNHPDFPTMP